MRSKRLLTIFCLILTVASAHVTFSQDKPASTADSQAATSEARRLRTEGLNAFGRKQYKEAEKDFLAALEKAKTASDVRLRGPLYNDLGNVNAAMRRDARARDYHVLALHFYEKRHETGSTAALHNALFLYNIGNDWNNLGNSTKNPKCYEEALSNLTRSLSLYDSQQNFSYTLMLLNELDWLRYRLGRYDALDYYRHALELRQKLGNAEDVAKSFENLGNSCVVLGRNDEALQSLEEALTFWTKLKNKPGIASSLSKMGHAYLNLFQFNEALDACTQALAIFPASDKINIAVCYMRRSGAYAGVHKYNEAAEDCQHAIKLYQQASDLKGVANGLLILSLLSSFTNVSHIPGVTLSGTLGKGQAPTDTMSIALILLAQGSADLSRGKALSSSVNLQRAQSLFVKLHTPQYLTACSNLLAEAYAQQGLLDKAQAEYQTAITHYEDLSEQVGDPGQLGLLQASGPNLYAHYARLLVQQKQPVRALLIAERGRAQGLARQAAQNQVTYNASVLSKAETVELRRRNEALRSAANSYFVRHLPNAQARYEKAKQERDLLNTVLYKRHAAYKRLRGAEPPTFAQLQTLARQHPDTLYLEWAIVDEKTSLLFALSYRHDLQAFSLPYGIKTLFDLTHKWRVSLNATAQLNDQHTPSTRRGTLLDAQAAEPHIATELYTLLFSRPERAGMFTNVRRLVFVADGPLLNAPFAALRDARGKRLIERYALTSAISLGTLLWPPNPRQPEKTLLSLADPTGDTAQGIPAPTAGGTSGASPTYGPLPSARDYGTKIAASVPGALLYLGRKAQKAVILPQLPHYAVLLFATHGALNANNGLRSALILASAGAGKQPHDTLEAREIIGQQLSARLAILAACESGLGQEGGGEGLLGLAWAFRAAGCPCVTASQWSVDDEATSLLMKRFYDGLKAHKRKDDALREAMLQVRHNPDYTRAYYWAAFQVIGDTGPISFGNLSARQSLRPSRH